MFAERFAKDIGLVPVLRASRRAVGIIRWILLISLMTFVLVVVAIICYNLWLMNVHAQEEQHPTVIQGQVEEILGGASIGDIKRGVCEGRIIGYSIKLKGRADPVLVYHCRADEEFTKVMVKIWTRANKKELPHIFLRLSNQGVHFGDEWKYHQKILEVKPVGERGQENKAPDSQFGSGGFFV